MRIRGVQEGKLGEGGNSCCTGNIKVRKAALFRVIKIDQYKNTNRILLYKEYYYILDSKVLRDKILQ